MATGLSAGRRLPTWPLWGLLALIVIFPGTVPTRARSSAADPPAVTPADDDDKFVPKRRRDLSEEELRDQLARTPEMTIAGDTGVLLLNYRANLSFGFGVYLDPTTLLQVRSDFERLPIRSGPSCHLDERSAATLEVLSRKLRIYLAALAPQDAEGKRTDPARLREVIRTEMRGKRPEWLRAEAVPTMLQLLMHEDEPVRAMLVDFLAEIKEWPATVALAQRAVFDLSPEVRAAAVRALDGRPRDHYRRILLKGLRYPWAPAADHAAEALLALGDRESVPTLVNLLKEPDPAAPFPNRKGQLVVREVVRFNHLANCLSCHPPALTGNDPVLGLDPVVRVPSASAGLTSAVQSLISTPGSHSYNMGGSTRLVPLPIRGDITYLRQDFSVQLPVQLNTRLRYDFVLQTRPATRKEIARLRSTTRPPADFEQRDALLFALRGLTGRDPGKTYEEWQTVVPKPAELRTGPAETPAAQLGEELVTAEGESVDRLLDVLSKGKGSAFTLALANAVPKLDGDAQKRAREILADRLSNMTAVTLREWLRYEDAEIRRAAALACGMKDDRTHVPDLFPLLEDHPFVVRAAHAALKSLTGQDHGPAADATADECRKAADAWRTWWKEKGEP